MFDWPKLELTEYEKLWVRHYKTQVGSGRNARILPGVLRRTYERTISNSTTITDSEGLQPSEQIQISRRARVFGLTFTGALSNTRLQITNASGTLYTVRDSRTAVDPYVSALVGGSPYMSGSLVGGKQSRTAVEAGTDTVSVLSGEQPRPLVIEPNWVLTPNETLIFNGDWDDADNSTGVFVLGIAVHVWEFPEMGNADKAVQEVL